VTFTAVNEINVAVKATSVVKLKLKKLICKTPKRFSQLIVIMMWKNAAISRQATGFDSLEESHRQVLTCDVQAILCYLYFTVDIDIEQV